MQSTFKQMVQDLVAEGIQQIGDLSDLDKRLLTAAYLREADNIEVWEFITEPPANENLPELLINLLEDSRNGNLKLCAPELTLALTMATAAVDWCLDNIEYAIEKAVVDQNYENRNCG